MTWKCSSVPRSSLRPCFAAAAVAQGKHQPLPAEPQEHSLWLQCLCRKTIKKCQLPVLTYKLHCSFNTSNKTHCSCDKKCKSWDCDHRLWCCDLLFVDPRNNCVALQVEAKPGTWKVVETLKTTGLNCLSWYLHRNTGGKRDPDIFWKTK